MVGADSSLELAAYSYDGGRSPNEHPDLLQPFSTRLSFGTNYLLSLDVAPSRTIYTLGDANASATENVTIVHTNACTDATDGYTLGLYFGGSCPAPHAITVCYAPQYGWHRSVTVLLAFAALVALVGCCVIGVRKWRQRRGNLNHPNSQRAAQDQSEDGVQLVRTPPHTQQPPCS